MRDITIRNINFQDIEIVENHSNKTKKGQFSEKCAHSAALKVTFFAFSPSLIDITIRRINFQEIVIENNHSIETKKDSFGKSMLTQLRSRSSFSIFFVQVIEILRFEISISKRLKSRKTF